MADINVGVLSEQINSKADIDLRNIDTTKCDMVIEYQEPTEENNYTWYRLYATGWIEQGGRTGYNLTGVRITLPVKMADTKYFVSTTYSNTDSDGTGGFERYPGTGILTTTDFWIDMPAVSNRCTLWQVSGKVDPSVMLNHEILPSKAKNEEFEHRVIAFQKPTADNNYTWYRKYADGWVEQGGVNNDSTLAGVATTITLPVEMVDTNYTITAAKNTDDTTATYGWGLRIVKSDKTVNSFKVRPDSDGGFFWRVEGLYVE